ncbi:helix-turn-helix domain-containing protein [Jeotgalibacillus terrae]|uniref:Helix-turn-helix domain-containing protein n=1 Tax=Jeotgalibacillus terrae TaxID=587735 RepID=A0ABW5ZN27_9BACL|nr:helix-turn-helix transcriptional regulator [Jeotgalibacillus terrae]MBM7578188.1 transcriptional regulator with XRE-family HTH domain [Jeotgalibacillus terrae]
MKREWLIELRKAKELTQQKVADQSFIDRSYYSQLENGVRDPSPSVAENIAKVLNFDFLRFFTDHFYQNEPNMPMIKTVRTDHDVLSLVELKHGKVMYHYSNIEAFSKNTTAFILSKVRQNIPCVIINHNKSSLDIYHELNQLLPQSEIENYVHFCSYDISTDPVNSDFYKLIKEKVKHHQYFNIWINDTFLDRKDSFQKLKIFIETCEIELKDYKWLLICSFDASMVSANEYIKAMKLFHYMMTDHELVSSPFHNKQYVKASTLFDPITDKE